MAYDDEDIDELRLRIANIVRQNEILILKVAVLQAAGDELAETAEATCREVAAFALHDAASSWRKAIVVCRQPDPATEKVST